LITDDLRFQLAKYIKDNVDGGKIGLGGNSTSPAASDLDVPIGSISVALTTDQSTENVVELKLSIAGNAIPGKVVREAGFFDGSLMFGRESFDGVGPFTSTETLEIFFVIEVE
jgi:hypothetical protein